MDSEVIVFIDIQSGYRAIYRCFGVKKGSSAKFHFLDKLASTYLKILRSQF